MTFDDTFMHFLLMHQKRHNRTLNFLILMESILSAAKAINYHYNAAAIHGQLGEAGSTNVQDETVMQLDVIANNAAVHYLTESQQVIEAISEEVEDRISLNADGRYFVYFDPLDGSSNVKHSLPVGFLFGIGKKNLDGPEDKHLRAGSEFIASGMFLIPSGTFNFALRDSGTWQFIADHTQTYVRPRRLFFPEAKKTWELSWNSGNRPFFSDKIQAWLEKNEADFNFRYGGSLAVDFHRLLTNGGMFMYPAIVNHPKPDKNRPEGKLRLMYECAVVAMLAKEAGGHAVDEQGRDILEISPEDAHQRSALYVGNKPVIEDVAQALQA